MKQSFRNIGRLYLHVAAAFERKARKAKKNKLDGSQTTQSETDILMQNT